MLGAFTSPGHRVAHHRNPPTIELPKILDEIELAVRAEQTAVRIKLGGLTDAKLVAKHGERLTNEPGAVIYAFDVECPLIVPDGTRVLVEASGVRTAGELIDHDTAAGIVTFVLRDDLGESVEAAEVTFDASELLDALLTRFHVLLTGAARSPNSAPAQVRPNPRVDSALAFLRGIGSSIPSSMKRPPTLSDVQARAVETIVRERNSYLWGPPGTGKTATIAYLVNELATSGERALVGAHTNIATDNALLRIQAVMEKHGARKGDVVRVGPAGAELRAKRVDLDLLADDELRGDETLYAEMERVASVFVRSRSPGWEERPIGRKLRLAAEAAGETDDDDTQIDATRLAELMEALGRCERGIIGRAKVVGTTLTRLFTNPLFSDFATDTVVIDEASTASIASAFIAATCATIRIVAVGDFMQLPAIVQSNDLTARKWLGTHVFESAGCADAAVEHPLRPMLDEQWRMPPDIASVVSRQFYSNRLKTSADRLRETKPGKSMALVDTSRLGIRAETSPSGSKLNRAHAALVARMCSLCSEKIAVIAPYRSQVRAIREAVRERQARRLQSGDIEVFTVHRYQGRESPVVIFDLTEAHGVTSRFLDEKQNREARNLINVAISRATHRLVVLANVEHMRNVLGRASQVGRVFGDLRAFGLELYAGDPSDEDKLRAFLGGERA